MVDKALTQSIEFIGKDIKPTLAKAKGDEKKIMDIDTEITIMESTKNFNKMVNNMFAICSKICIKDFSNGRMSVTEAKCAENCQKKFYESYAIGERLVCSVMENSKNNDIFSNKTEVDIIEEAKKKLI